VDLPYDDISGTPEAIPTLLNLKAAQDFSFFHPLHSKSR
jgi:hypothetical protein